MSHDEMISVIQAHKDGKTIECKKINPTTLNSGWFNAEPFWDFAAYNYRVAPEPRKPREWWIDLRVGYGMVFDCPESGRPDARIHVREIIE